MAQELVCRCDHREPCLDLCGYYCARLSEEARTRLSEPRRMAALEDVASELGAGG